MLRSHSEQAFQGQRVVAAHSSPRGGWKMNIDDVSVKDIDSADVPLYAFDASRRQHMRKVRSFGEFAVPDVDMDDNGSDDSGEISRPESPGKLDDGSVPVADADGGGTNTSMSLFDHHVCSGWDECVKLQKFKYDLSTTESRTLPGTLGFVAQLNEGRATKKRQTEFKVDEVKQSFDEMKFNFKKVSGSEVLFRFEPLEEDSIIEMEMDKEANQGNSIFVSEGEEKPHIHESPNLVIINVSPIEYGHILLVPRVKDSLPQQVAPSTMHFALQMAAESDNPFFRVGFNSLGAYGSVNHLHFQGYYLDAPFPVERAPTVAIPGLPQMINRVRVTQLAEYPVRGIVMEMVHEGELDLDSSLWQLAKLCGNACRKLARANVPHNIFIVDGGSRLFLFPQCYQARISAGVVPEWILNTGVNPAAFEISGHLLMKTRDDFDALDETKACRMLEQVSLDESDFLDAVRICLS